MTKSIQKHSLRGRWLQATLCIVAVLGSTFLGTADIQLRAQTSKGESSPTGTPDWQVAAGTELSFEVATVKPDKSDADAEVNFTLGPGDTYSKTGGRLIASNISLLDYIRFAYKLTDGQTQILEAKAPKWLAVKRFDIDAKSEDPDATKDQMRLMMQSLLAERFKLVLHSDTRQLPVLALVLAKPGKLGPQIKPHPAGETCSNILAAPQQRPAIASGPATPTVCGGLVSSDVPREPSHVRIAGRNVFIALLAAHLGEMGQFDRPILDRTGLKGTFDFTLEWGIDPAPSSTSPPDHASMETSLQEALLDQLGLKLQRQNGPVEIFLVDGVDQQPTTN